MYAQNNKGWFMDAGNGNGTWDYSGNTRRVLSEVHQIHPAARDTLVEYGLPRGMFFCPENPENPWPTTGVAWERPDIGNFAFTGYMILGGRTKLTKGWKNAEASGGGAAFTMKGWEEVKDVDPDGMLQLFPSKLGRKAFYEILVTDMTRSKDNNLAPSNHVVGRDDGSMSEAAGFMARGKGGSNIGFTDGHVEWKQQGELGQKASKSKPNPGFRQFTTDNRFYF
jgi:prepilin-type processing-associated H-X9-DG protein